MGSCPEHDDGEDESGNKKRKKEGVDSTYYNERKY